MKNNNQQSLNEIINEELQQSRQTNMRKNFEIKETEQK